MSNDPHDGGRFRFLRQVPTGDDKERLVCSDCGWVHYVNPVIVVGAVVHHEGKLLLCRRDIEPRRGYWTMPAGFMEAGESADDGARREALEEAGAEITIEALLGIYSIARLNQVHLIYRARLAKPEFAAGIESQAVELFDWDCIPWDDLAFPTVKWSLEHYAKTKDSVAFAPFTEPR